MAAVSTHPANLGPSPEIVDLEVLASGLTPENTVLLLGAGASIPCGAPSGKDLAIELSEELRERVVSDDLQEAATILQQTVGRQQVVNAIRSRLMPLKPRGGMTTLPEFDWCAIYTTNYDALVEKAYRAIDKPIAVVRSNFDWSVGEQEDSMPLFKIHGCVTQDQCDGHRAGMLLTEQDYADHANYREALFARLGADLLTRDVLVIGQSLSDPHLQSTMRAAAQAKASHGAPGRLYALIYEQDADRAVIWLSRGFAVAFGDLDTFMHALSCERPAAADYGSLSGERLLLKPVLRVAAIDVDQEVALPADAVRMFNGRAATYADIGAGYTFSRTVGMQLVTRLQDTDCRYLTITGVAGVGKTTLARQLLADMRAKGAYCWEHVTDHPLSPEEWHAVARQLGERDQLGYLLLDDAAAYLQQVNALVQKLERDETHNLTLVITATNSQWAPRIKDPALFRSGHAVRLSELTADDISALVRLSAEQAEIRSLVDPTFGQLPHDEQVKRLRHRARADMYVCLKNIFANVGLDDILLQEFADLEVPQQDVYRFVAALEASGGRVHRQLVLRLLGITADAIAGLLERLDGIVDEYDISPRDGIYGWATRHELIAATIAKYKYSDQQQLLDLLTRTVDALNPSIQIELRALREMCNADFGIATITDDEAQVGLYEKIIAVAPGERAPRHSLIRKLLQLRNAEAAAQSIRRAEDEVGYDRPLARYKVRLAILRAETTPGILSEDRVAILRGAQPIALDAIRRFAGDKFAYMAYAELGVAVAEMSSDISMLDDAVEKMVKASERILDPAMTKDIERYERQRRKLSQAS
jgi:SIR2-like protein